MPDDLMFNSTTGATSELPVDISLESLAATVCELGSPPQKTAIVIDAPSWYRLIKDHKPQTRDRIGFYGGVPTHVVRSAEEAAETASRLREQGYRVIVCPSYMLAQDGTPSFLYKTRIKLGYKYA